jgi:hypothetical protein
MLTESIVAEVVSIIMEGVWQGLQFSIFLWVDHCYGSLFYDLRGFISER